MRKHALTDVLKVDEVVLSRDFVGILKEDSQVA